MLARHSFPLPSETSILCILTRLFVMSSVMELKISIWSLLRLCTKFFFKKWSCIWVMFHQLFNQRHDLQCFVRHGNAEIIISHTSPCYGVYWDHANVPRQLRRPEGAVDSTKYWNKLFRNVVRWRAVCCRPSRPWQAAEAHDGRRTPGWGCVPILRDAVRSR